MMLTPDAPLYVRPGIDLPRWRWLLRFALRCNLRDWETSARDTMPGAASGVAWLGVIVPQFPCELPPPMRPASMTCTPRPSSSNASAAARPTAPAPTTSTSAADPAAPRASSCTPPAARRIAGHCR